MLANAGEFADFYIKIEKCMIISNFPKFLENAENM
jgi:hypothetical protein